MENSQEDGPTEQVYTRERPPTTQLGVSRGVNLLERVHASSSSNGWFWPAPHTPRTMAYRRVIVIYSYVCKVIYLDSAKASARPFRSKFMLFFARTIINVGINLTSKFTRQKI